MGEIRRFRVEAPEAELRDLRARLRRTRWPEEMGEAYGAPTTWVRELADHWAGGYDWRAREADLNAVPQFVTEIGGQRVHFLHVPSPERGALPLVVTHGWPGSVVEFLRVLGPLSDPRAHGGDPEDAFHLVVPSIPGFGLSGPVTATGWTARRVAGAWAELMARLGYERFGAQGGDWGSGISRELGLLAPEHVVGVHVNTMTLRPEEDPLVVGLEAAAAMREDPAELAELTERERRRVRERARFRTDGVGYGALQATRPDTLGYALTDSPAGQLAWVGEKFREWSDPSLPPDRDLLLTNVMLYWLTRTAPSSARLYHETVHARTPGRGPRLTVPTGVAVFPHDIAPPIRRFAERDTNVVHWTEHERGGHFAAMEVPDLFVADVRAFFRRVRGAR